jgi:Uncharacterized protein conserved in bacteria (DUF2255)
MADRMSAWTSDELSRIGEADELEIASLRPDGSLRRPRTVWAFRHGDDIYARSVNGPDSAWYLGVQQRHHNRRAHTNPYARRHTRSPLSFDPLATLSRASSLVLCASTRCSGRTHLEGGRGESRPCVLSLSKGSAAHHPGRRAISLKPLTDSGAGLGSVTTRNPSWWGDGCRDGSAGEGHDKGDQGERE